MTVSDLTERELIARIRRHLAPAPSWAVVDIGDDAAVIEPERNRLEVLTVDAVVDGVHVDRRFTPASAIGHRALAVNLSDLAAMGAAPRLALLSMALPPDLPCDDFDAMAGGAAALAAAYRVYIAGGNLTRTTGPLVVDITAVGSVKRRGVLTRGGARVGDELYVTGTIGAAAAGLDRLKAESSASETPDACVRRYLYPEPRVRTGMLVSRNRAASACMDLSDGLTDAVQQVAEASKVGAIIEIGTLPIDPLARVWFDAAGSDAVQQAVSRGDDYELLFAVPRKLRRRFLAAVRTAGVPVTRIGVCTEGRELLARDHDGDRPLDTALPAGFSHFR